MDDKRFDDLIKRLCTTRLTRLSAIRGLAAGAAALAGASLVPEAEAQKKRGRRGQSRRNRGTVRRAEVCEPIVSTIGQSNNPTCADVGESGAFIKVDPPQSGSQTIKVGNCSCTINYTVTGGNMLSFESTCAVAKVIVKGGNEGGRVYDFGSCCGGGTKSASGLVTGTDRQAISHLNFCGIKCCEPETCQSLGYECGGPYNDGCCGLTEYCGDCTCPENAPSPDDSNFVCGTAGADKGQCLCVPDDCQSLGYECGGPYDDGCCDLIQSCGTCGCPNGGDDSNFVCGTAGADKGQCLCTKTPEATACAGKCGQTVGDGCCGEYQCPACPPQGQGCTPGYFKNHPQTFRQASLSSGAKVSTVFTFGSCCQSLGDKTLLEALSFRGGSTTCGAIETLLRAAVAAFLNATLVANYPLTPAQVKTQVSAALATCNRAAILALAEDLDAKNNLGCPCTNLGCLSS